MRPLLIGPAVFKNRAIQIKAVKTEESDTTTTSVMEDILNPDTLKLLEAHGKKFMKHLAITVAAVVVGIKIADTLSEIAVKKTKSADNE